MGVVKLVHTSTKRRSIIINYCRRQILIRQEARFRTDPKLLVDNQTQKIYFNVNNYVNNFGLEHCL